MKNITFILLIIFSFSLFSCQNGNIEESQELSTQTDSVNIVADSVIKVSLSYQVDNDLELDELKNKILLFFEGRGSFVK